MCGEKGEMWVLCMVLMGGGGGVSDGAGGLVGITIGFLYDVM